MGPEPLLQLASIGKPVVRMESAKASLLVNGIKLTVRLKAQDIRLKHSYLQTFCFQQGPSPGDRSWRVVNPGDIETAPGQLCHLPAATASRNYDSAWLQIVAIQPCEQLRTWRAAVPTRLSLLETFLPKFSSWAGHMGLSASVESGSAFFDYRSYPRP